PKIKDAIFTNVTGGWIVFHIDEKDVPNFKLKTQPIGADELASLPPHTAFIKIGTEEPVIVKTPPPVPPRESHADYIRKRTFELYACRSAPVPHTSEYGDKPEPQPTLPHDTREAPHPPASRGVLRAPNQRPRHPTTKPNTH